MNMEQSKKFLDKINAEMILLSVLFLFFLQMITELISAIYMLDLLNTSVDEKAAGLLFLLSSIFLIFLKKDYSTQLIKISGIILIVARLITPLVATLGKIITAGFGVGAFMIFFPSYLLFSSSMTKKSNGLNYGLSLAIGTGLSILFRTLNSTLDISMYSWYQLIGVILAIIALVVLLSVDKVREFNQQDEMRENKEVENEEPIHKKTNGNFKKGIKVFILIIGIINTFLLIYIAFEGPTVISR